jgi:hypothetical protein
MSFLGRIGIHTMYRQFMVFRSWWKTALLFFFIQCLLFGVLYTIRSIVSLAIAKKIAWLLLLVGIGGFIATYWDFTTTMHRVMKIRFHFGFYLFWIGWAINCLYFIVAKDDMSKSILQEQEKENVDALQKEE